MKIVKHHSLSFLFCAFFHFIVRQVLKYSFMATLAKYGNKITVKYVCKKIAPAINQFMMKNSNFFFLNGKYCNFPLDAKSKTNILLLN